MYSRSSDSFGSMTLVPVKGGLGRSLNGSFNRLERASGSVRSVRREAECCVRSFPARAWFVAVEGVAGSLSSRSETTPITREASEHVDGRSVVGRRDADRGVLL